MASRWFLVLPLAIVVLALVFVGVSPRNDALEGSAVGTSGEMDLVTGGTIGTPIADLMATGGAEDLTDLIGTRVALQFDMTNHANDVAFWTGYPPDNLLVVTDYRLRYAAPTDGIPHGPVMASGVVRPVPYPEATYSWNLSRRELDLLADRGVYVYVDRLVYSPSAGDAEAADQTGELGRDRGDLEDPLTLPPPTPLGQ